MIIFNFLLISDFYVVVCKSSFTGISQTMMDEIMMPSKTSKVDCQIIISPPSPSSDVCCCDLLKTLHQFFIILSLLTLWSNL